MATHALDADVQPRCRMLRARTPCRILGGRFRGAPRGRRHEQGEAVRACGEGAARPPARHIKGGTGRRHEQGEGPGAVTSKARQAVHVVKASQQDEAGRACCEGAAGPPAHQGGHRAPTRARRGGHGEHVVKAPTVRPLATSRGHLATPTAELVRLTTSGRQQRGWRDNTSVSTRQGRGPHNDTSWGRIGLNAAGTHRQQRLGGAKTEGRGCPRMNFFLRAHRPTQGNPSHGS